MGNEILLFIEKMKGILLSDGYVNTCMYCPSATDINNSKKDICPISVIVQSGGEIMQQQCIKLSFEVGIMDITNNINSFNSPKFDIRVLSETHNSTFYAVEDFITKLNNGSDDELTYEITSIGSVIPLNYATINVLHGFMISFDVVIYKKINNC